MLCEYGCDTEARYKLNNGKRCCEDKYQKCSFYRLKAKKESSKYWKIEDNRIKASNISKKRFLNETENEKEERINRHIKVYKETNRSLKLHSYKLENFDKRGRNKFHLDHRYSIHKGFKNNIDSKIIGHIKNLQMLPESENIKKGTTCSIELQELLSYIK
jgi:hypothetical protein